MPRRSMKKTNKKIAKLLKEGLSYKEIAELTGTDRMQVSRVKYMVKNGLLCNKRKTKTKVDPLEEKYNQMAKEILESAYQQSKIRSRGRSGAEHDKVYFTVDNSLFTKIKRFFGV